MMIDFNVLKTINVTFFRHQLIKEVKSCIKVLHSFKNSTQLP